MKMLITLEPDGIFGSNFVYFCILTLSSNWYAKRCKASPSIILTGRALLLKMLITLEPHGKGLGSPTGFFSPVLCQKFKHNLQSYQLVFLLFDYLCAPNIQKN